MFVFAGIASTAAAWANVERRRTAIGPERELPTRLIWLTSNSGLITVFLTVAGAGVAATLIMIVLAGTAHTGPSAGNRTQLRIEAIKYGLGAVAAAGAAVALLLALARHRLSEEAHRLAERTQVHTERDAAHRRVTELFARAVDQLGHEQAAVRLGSLYALERVAQDDPRQQQTVIDVLCAYLRMPFMGVGADEGLSPSDIQVRLTAQRMIAKHLRIRPILNGAEPAWENIDLDLTGATLIDWTLGNCRVRSAQFIRATFHGSAYFDGTVMDSAWFSEATFTGPAGLSRMEFTREAQFGRVKFGAGADFGQTRFSGDAWFADAVFNGATSFRKASFESVAEFGGATFLAAVHFDGSSVPAGAWFEGVTIGGSGASSSTLPAGWQKVADRGTPVVRVEQKSTE